MDRSAATELSAAPARDERVGFLQLSAAPARDERVGFLLVFLSALFWSFGGAIARFLEADDSWTVVFWRSSWAAIFLVGYMLWRDGARGLAAMVRQMGLPGIAVALCFATASTAFVVALAYTTVANILLMQAGVPLIAALIAWVLFRERVSAPTWAAIAAVIAGVGIMVSESLTGDVSPVGDGLALLIAVAFSIATVITRRFAHVRMTPATCLGTLIAGCFAATQASTLAVSAPDMGFLFAFGALNLGLGLACFATGARLIPAAFAALIGALNLGLGLACFATGARLIPAAFAALIGTLETVLGPVWVWLIHAEAPSARTVVGGAVVFAALLVHIGLEFRRQARTVVGVTGVPARR